MKSHKAAVVGAIALVASLVVIGFEAIAQNKAERPAATSSAPANSSEIVRLSAAARAETGCGNPLHSFGSRGV